MSKAATVEAEYKVFDNDTGCHILLRESPDVPGLTELVQVETNSVRYESVVLRDDAIPALIEALTRRLRDIGG